MLDEGIYGTVSDIGDAENISKSYISRILRLALLAPDVVEDILAGTADHALGKLARPLPPGWEEQRRLLGHAPPEPTCARARDICMPVSGADTAKRAVQRSTPSHSGQMIWATPPSTREG
jgi:hypothetical protein